VLQSYLPIYVLGLKKVCLYMKNPFSVILNNKSQITAVKYLDSKSL